MAERVTATPILVGTIPAASPNLIKAELAPMVDTVLNRYHIRHLIAEGNRSVVYSAIDSRLNRRVVVKRMRDELTHSPAHKELAREQAELFADCNASHLVKILDYDPETGTIVLEAMSHDLAKSVKDKGCDWGFVREVLRNVLSGLASLHSRGIAHGRVELEHLLVDDNGGVKLAVTPGMTGQRTAQCPGANTKHLAPELLKPSLFGEAGMAVDIYALGFIALELLCGKKFASKVSPSIVAESSLTKEWLQWHASPTDHLPSISGMVAGLPDEVAEFLQRMTSKQQYDRYDDAPQCLEALQRFSASETRNRASTVPPPRFADEPAVDSLGSPPPVHQPEVHDIQLTWTEIGQDWRVLFQPRGRKHLAVVGVGLLMCCSMFMLLGSGKPPQPIGLADGQRMTTELEPVAEEPGELQEIEETAQSDLQSQSLPTLPSLPIAPGVVGEGKVPSESKPNLVVRNWKVRFLVQPAGRIDCVVGHDPNLGQPGTWNLDRGTYLVKCFDSQEQEFTVTIGIPSGGGEMDFTIDVPQNQVSTSKSTKIQSPEPYEDVRDIHYVPTWPRFEIAGAENSQIAIAQADRIRIALEPLIQEPNKKQQGEYPIRLADRAFDPRASFALALLAYHRGDEAYKKVNRNLALEMCRKSMADAEELNVPFVGALQLLNQIQLELGDYAAAVAGCRRTMDWVANVAVRTGDERFVQVADQVAWWTGLVLGYIKDARESPSICSLDYGFTEATINSRWSESQVQKYRIGRYQVYKRFQEIAPQWKRLVLSQRAGEAFATSLTSGQIMQLHNGGADYNSPSDSESPELDPSNSGAAFYAARRNSPWRFTTFQPFDFTALAEQGINTLLIPSESKFAIK